MPRPSSHASPKLRSRSHYESYGVSGRKLRPKSHSLLDFWVISRTLAPPTSGRALNGPRPARNIKNLADKQSPVAQIPSTSPSGLGLAYSTPPLPTPPYPTPALPYPAPPYPATTVITTETVSRTRAATLPLWAAAAT